MDISDADFPKYAEFEEASQFVFATSKPKSELVDELRKPIVRVQYKLSSKRRQVVVGSESEEEELLTPRLAKLAKNSTMRSMASQVVRDLSPKNKFRDEEVLEVDHDGLDVRTAGLQRLLKFKDEFFDAMLVDPLELSGKEIERIEETNLFDGKVRTIKEELFLPIKQAPQEFTVWEEWATHHLLVNKNNQKLILEQVEKMLMQRVRVKGFKAIEIVTYLENMFLHKNKSTTDSLIVFDTEID